MIHQLNLYRQKDGSMSGGFAKSNPADIDLLCSAGVTLAALPKPEPDTDTKYADQKSVNVLPTLPSSFNIRGKPRYGGGTEIVGNLYVPGLLPANHNAHSTQFKVAQTNFRSASQTYALHFVNMLLHSSLSQWVPPADFHGKGILFGYDGTFCSSQNGGNPVYSIVTETWVFPTPPSGNPGAAARVASGATLPGVAADEAPWHSCNFLSGTTSYEINSSATRSQLSKYWFRPVGTTTWIPGALVNSSDSNFRGGYAGIAFGVVVDQTTQFNVGSWLLSFTDVTQWTIP